MRGLLLLGAIVRLRFREIAAESRPGICFGISALDTTCRLSFADVSRAVWSQTQSRFGVNIPSSEDPANVRSHDFISSGNCMISFSTSLFILQ
jgi:hypothetical protein